MFALWNKFIVIRNSPEEKDHEGIGRVVPEFPEKCLRN